MVLLAMMEAMVTIMMGVGQDEGSKGGVSHDRSGGSSDNGGGKDKGSSGSSSGE
jgi:hypothetical protein